MPTPFVSLELTPRILLAFADYCAPQRRWMAPRNQLDNELFREAGGEEWNPGELSSVYYPSQEARCGLPER